MSLGFSWPPWDLCTHTPPGSGLPEGCSVWANWYSRPLPWASPRNFSLQCCWQGMFLHCYRLQIASKDGSVCACVRVCVKERAKDVCYQHASCLQSSFCLSCSLSFVFLSLCLCYFHSRRKNNIKMLVEFLAVGGNVKTNIMSESWHVIGWIGKSL